MASWSLAPTWLDQEKNSGIAIFRGRAGHHQVIWLRVPEFTRGPSFFPWLHYSGNCRGCLQSLCYTYLDTCDFTHHRVGTHYSGSLCRVCWQSLFTHAFTYRIWHITWIGTHYSGSCRLAYNHILTSAVFIPYYWLFIWLLKTHNL